MSDGGELATIRAFANKAGEHVVRVAGVRTIYADADAAEIADAAVAGAIDLVQHYLGEAMRLRGMAGEGAHLRQAQDVLDFIKGIGRPVVHLAEIYQHEPAETRDAAAAREAMRILVDHGHVEAFLISPAGSAGRECCDDPRPKTSVPISRTCA